MAALVALVAGWLLLRASLPLLDGACTVSGLGGDVTIERDADGIPTVHARTWEDLMRGLGFLHAQDRFFEMDLLRRQSAGELADLFGAPALPLDLRVRPHRFRQVAAETLKTFPEPDMRELDAYVGGVNAGLDALGARPWEYFLMRQKPRPWTREDSILVDESMMLALQDSTGIEQRTRLAIQEVYGPEALAFLRPQITEATAALDGSSAPAPPVPGPAEFVSHPAPSPAAPPAQMPTVSNSGLGAALAGFLSPGGDARAGSNSFALAGSRVAGGGALVANDMHLGLSVPNVWYRASLVLNGQTFSGVTLPGAPCPIAGSNGDVAWGFTDAYIGASDVVIVEPDPADPRRYRVPDGDRWEKFTVTHESVAVAGSQPVTTTIVSTRWGPLLTQPGAPGRALALHWIAYDPQAVNFELSELIGAHSVDDVIEVARRTGIPAENLVVGDRAGHIAWTIIGRVPHRIGFDGSLPQSWADGSRDWDGFLAPADIPVVRDPPDGQLWTANNRVVGGGALASIGNGGYDFPARAGQIRDRLTALGERPATPADLLAIQLDDESRFLQRWRDLLMGVLSDQAVAKEPGLAELRRLTRQWSGHASTNEAGHRLVRTFRSTVATMVLNPIYQPVRQREPDSDFGPVFEQPLWSILCARPAHLLPSAVDSWDALLLRAARLTAKLGEHQPGGVPLRECTWGSYNTLAMRHPFSQALPSWLASRVDMPADQLPGDNNMPRVQDPSFGASQRMAVTPGREREGIFHQPGGASGHPLSPFYFSGHGNWAAGRPAPFLPGETKYRLTLHPPSG